MMDYLTVAEVLAMHTDQIERYGGSHGVSLKPRIDWIPFKKGRTVLGGSRQRPSLSDHSSGYKRRNSG